MYTALYRKWRPMTFDDVVSQPHITTTLSKQISEAKQLTPICLQAQGEQAKPPAQEFCQGDKLP